MTYHAIRFQEKFSLFNEFWSPKVVAEMNNYQFKLVKIKGEFVWHQHDKTDETFIVLNGKMRIEFEDGTVQLESGEMFVVPCMKPHRPVAENECQVLVIEPKHVCNTGEIVNEMTAPNDVWI